MAENKILKFAENATNIQTDAEYQSNTERTNGNTLNSIADSALMNKVLKQVSSVAWAIGQIVANAGQNADDADPSAIITGLTNVFQSIKRANTVTTSSATWVLTFDSALDTSVPNVIMFLTQVASQANQKLSINSVAYDLVRYQSGRNVGNTISASASNPFPVIAVVYGTKAYMLSDLSASEINALLTHLTTYTNPHNVTAAQAGAVPESGHAASSIVRANSSGYLVDQAVDSTPTASSTRLVTSGGVKAALDAKQNALSFPLSVANGGTGNSSVDTSPTSGSAKMVTSGGVYNALNAATTRQAPVSNYTAGGTKTLALTDAGKWFNCYTANVTISIPTNTSVSFPIGTEILFHRHSTPTVTFAAASGVTIHSIGGLSILDAYGVACLKKVGQNTWVLFGDV